MRRREFLTSSAALVCLMGSAAAEPSRPWRVALILSGIAGPVDIFRETLHHLGYEVGKNLLLEIRYARGNNSLLPDLAKEVVSLKPDVIVADTTPAIEALHKATSTIPIVILSASDPIGSGFVRSFAHPGGNITGVANMYDDLTPKTLQFLHLILPNAKKIAVLTSDNPIHPRLFEIVKRGAETIGISAERFIAETPNDLEAAFKAMKSANCEAVYVMADPPRPLVPELALRFGLPAIYQIDEYIRMGGLMSYGPDSVAFFVKAASYVDRILKGNSPAEMPVEQPTTFRFTINFRAAKALGLAIPESVLAQADEVIE